MKLPTPVVRRTTACQSQNQVRSARSVHHSKNSKLTQSSSNDQNTQSRQRELPCKVIKRLTVAAGAIQQGGIPISLGVDKAPSVLSDQSAMVISTIALMEAPTKQLLK